MKPFFTLKRSSASTPPRFSVLGVAFTAVYFSLGIAFAQASAQTGSESDDQTDHALVNKGPVEDDFSDVKVDWLNPEKYRDIRPTNEPRKRFQQRLFKQFNQFFAELAEDLPERYSLHIQVTNVDLAGQVWPASFLGYRFSTGSDIRLTRRADIPRMHFRYTLRDEHNRVVKEDAVKLKDMSFQVQSSRFRRGDPLRYEKEMLRRWYRKTIAEDVRVQETLSRQALEKQALEKEAQAQSA